MASAFNNGNPVRKYVRIYVLNVVPMEGLTLDRMNLDHRTRARVMKACWEQKMFVVVRPMGIGWSKKPFPVQLVMDLQGMIKVGEDSYQQNSSELERKINEMYLYIYKKFIY